jgi:hypothetical protein
MDGLRSGNETVTARLFGSKVILPKRTLEQSLKIDRVADFYLIAFTDETVQTAVAYSVEGDTLRWTTRDHLDREAPVSAVDRRFSEQLNRDRGVDFRLP